MQERKREPGNLHNITMEGRYARLDCSDHAGDGPEADQRPVFPGYFEALAIPLVRGRYFEQRDNETGDHLARMQHYSRLLAETASAAPSFSTQIDAKFVQMLECCAPLHDIGKVGIPDAILEKPGVLDAGEWEFIHQHTILGERILSAAPALRPVAKIVRASHERWDGRGYPDGLRGEEIPLAARIVAVCDAYEAITSERTPAALTASQTFRKSATTCGEIEFI